MADGGEIIFKFKGDDKDLKETTKNVNEVAQKALKGVAIGTAAVVTGFAAIVTESVKARGEMEQLAGGVEKIFGESAEKVTENAQKAYKTAGISASQYMEQVTSFSASLLQSVGGDTVEAARIADQAIIDMADNANTFGTSIESIQSAYQSFAKQNYQMLDNLKLGYGGTKKEMERLLKDAQKLTGVKYDINNLNDVYEAIHAIQVETKIAGTTANESANTLTGSITSMQSAWQNFLSGTGDLGQVVDSVSTAFTNIVRIVNDALPDIMENFYNSLPELIKLGGDIISTIATSIFENLPLILDMGLDIITSLIDGISENIDTIIPVVIQILEKIILTLMDHIPELLEAGVKLIIALAKGLIKALPQVISAIFNILSNLGETISNERDKIKAKGLELIKKMAEGIKNGVSSALSAIGNVLTSVKNSITNKFREIINNARNWGRDMVNGFADGIRDRLGALQDSVSGVVNSIKSKLHFSRPDEGPLRDYETWMPDMIKGMANSLDKAAPYLLGKIGDLASAMSMSPTINGNINSVSPSVNVSVHSNYEQDPLGQMVSTIKTFSNGAKNDYNYGYGG